MKSLNLEGKNHTTTKNLKRHKATKQNTWNVINDMITNSTSREQFNIETEDGEELLTAVDAAEALNVLEYLRDNVINETPNLQTSTPDKHTIFLQPTTQEGIRKTIREMKPKQSAE